MSRSRNREPASVRQNLFLLTPFEGWLALLALYAGLSHFIPLPSSGQAAAVEKVIPSLVTGWSLLYALGGLLVMLGLGRRSPRIEGAGLCLLAGGVIVSGIALLGAGALIVPTVVIQGSLAAACFVRLRVLWAL